MALERHLVALSDSKVQLGSANPNLEGLENTLRTNLFRVHRVVCVLATRGFVEKRNSDILGNPPLPQTHSPPLYGEPHVPTGPMTPLVVNPNPYGESHEPAFDR